MLKKTLYPFTDWNWLKLPLATFVLGCLIFVLVAVGGIGGALFYQDLEVAFGVAFAACFAIYLMTPLLALAWLGYLLRVARQPKGEQPLKLPSCRGLLALWREGFLGGLGALWISIFVTLLFSLPVYFVMFVSLGAGLGLANLTEWKTLGLFTTIAGGGVTLVIYLLALLAILIWYGQFVPLLLVRYAYTGKFRHLLSPRWAWRAFTIAPFQYVARTSAWTILLMLLTILTPLTVGLAYFIGMLLLPLSAINCFYLVGDYYALYLDD